MFTFVRFGLAVLRENYRICVLILSNIFVHELEEWGESGKEWHLLNSFVLGYPMGIKFGFFK